MTAATGLEAAKLQGKWRKARHLLAGQAASAAGQRRARGKRNEGRQLRDDLGASPLARAPQLGWLAACQQVRPSGA